MRSLNTCLEAAARLAILVSCFLPAAQGLDPNRALSQYIRDQWNEENGFPGGAVNAIAEFDGYLWIGAEKGLVRFDGKNFQLFNHANSSVFPSSPVLGLAADGDGNLWIRLQSPALLRYRDGVFQDWIPDMKPENGVTAMGRGVHNDILLARDGHPSRIKGGRFEPIPIGKGDGRRLIISVADTADGTVWIGTRDTGLFFLRDGQDFRAAGLPDRKVNCLLAGRETELWAGTDAGLVRWNGANVSADGVPDSLRKVQTLSLVRDRDHNVWAGTATGLVRIDQRGAFAAHAGTAPVNALFEDREGNLWVGGTQGIERYRDNLFLTSAAPGEGGPLYADDSGRVWVGSSRGGLSYWRDGERKQVAPAGLNNDVVYSIDGGPGELWIGRQRGGLTRLRTSGAAIAAETYTPSKGLAAGSVYAVHRNHDGTVWAGTLGGGVSRIRAGRVTTYTTADGLPSNTISAIEEGSNGTMWFATPNGLASLADGHWRVYSSQQGLPPGRIQCLTSDTGGVLWIGTGAGLAYLRDDRVQTPHQLPEALLDEVLGIAADRTGGLWIVTAKQVLRASRGHLLDASSGPIDLREFGVADGISSTQGVRRHRSVVADPAGRIWFALQHGIAVADPARLQNRSVPAIVHVQSVSADGNPLSTSGLLRIPAARQRITFSYIGLSLSVPDRVQFRYRLDNFDHDWSPPVHARETVYTNLSPGSYRFRVIASNSEGIWNSAEAAVNLQVTPAFWQTWWFRLSVATALAFSVFAAYRMRMHRLTTQLNLRFEERLAERTRIAQDLHDTLLQGLLSASMQLHVAVDRTPADAPSKPQLQRVLELMQRVVNEGRMAVTGLRSSLETDTLEDALSRIRTEQVIPESTDFRVIVEGRSRALNPMVRDEVYRIGREALVNAFRHSGAARVEAELQYGAGGLRLVVRDSGSGIDPDVVRDGRNGHFGLLGMRERAQRIGAGLKVWSRAAAGTEIELNVPAKIAFSVHAHEKEHDHDR